MKTIAECISKLQADLRAADLSRQLEQTYGDAILSEQDANRALALIDITYGTDYSFDAAAEKNHDVEWRQNYSFQSLQAAWNVAAIIGKVNVDGSFAVAGVTRTVYNLTMNDSNKKTYSQNLLDNLKSLDMKSEHGVPYIIDDVTYKINKAINEFIENINSIPQGRALIKASSYLGSLSFINMQNESGKRMASYVTYCEKSEKSNPIGMKVSEDPGSKSSDTSSSQDEDAEENFFDPNEDDEENFFDTRPDPEWEEKSFDALDNSLYGIARENIVRLVNQFVKEAVKNLATRSDETNQDEEQKKYCLQATGELRSIQSKVSDTTSMRELTNYLKEVDPQAEKTFAQNRSHTWFRKNISEPFESLKQKINCVLKYCGISMQLPIASTMTLEKYKAFKKECQATMAAENTKTNIEKDESDFSSRCRN